jgi:murein DD-endopeptidase MepM/ murein hydrolase activator NlpD
VRVRTLAFGVPLAVAVLLALAGPAAAAGPWVWPLAGPHMVSRGFDPPATPYGPGHRGADLPGRPGQAVLAAGAGRISYAGLLAGRGVVVVVHGELRTTYEPVTAAVRVGQQVTAGQVIGSLDAGHPGCTSACLHWGLLRGAVYLDPVQLVRRGPSRLLPLDRPAVAAGTQPAQRAALPASSAAPRPAGQPALSLRAGDAATAGGALAALVAGLVLLRRPPKPPDHPVAPAVSAGLLRAAAAPSLRDPEAAGLVDLASERHRRRPEVA